MATKKPQLKNVHEKSVRQHKPELAISTHKPKWIYVLEKELMNNEAQINRIANTNRSRVVNINKELAENFWHLWLRFNKLGSFMNMEPAPESFINFTVFPDEWTIKDDFDYSSIDKIALVDNTQTRIGDSLIANLFIRDGDVRLKINFQFLEGEKYHKYAGWKRHYSSYTLFDQPLNTLSMKDLQKTLGDVVKNWYGSYLKNNRKVIINYIKNNYKLAETFLK